MAIIATHTINLPAGWTSGGVLFTITGLEESDTLVITKPAAGTSGMVYDAWSPWASDVDPNIVEPGKPWYNRFIVDDGAGNIVFQCSSANIAPFGATAAAARAGIAAHMPIYLSGHTTYRWIGTEPPTADDRGGLSLLVEVSRNITTGDDPVFAEPHPPVVTIEEPAAGETISPSDFLRFTVRDLNGASGQPGAMSGCIIIAFYPDGSDDTVGVFPGEDDEEDEWCGFRPHFRASSTKEWMGDGWRFYVRPDDNWRPAPEGWSAPWGPALYIRAWDNTGRVNA